MLCVRFWLFTVFQIFFLLNNLGNCCLQLSDDVNFVWRLAKATHFKSKIASERDKDEERCLAYLSRNLAARSLEIDPHSAAAHKWRVTG